MTRPILQFRKMEPGDYPAVYQLWAETPGVDLTRSDEFPVLKNFLKRNPGLSQVVYDGERLVGAVLCGHDGRRGFLHHLAVDPEYRRMGIGSELVEGSLEVLRELGIEKCHLFIRRDNINGLNFWKAAGWQERVTLIMASRNLDTGLPDPPESC